MHTTKPSAEWFAVSIFPIEKPPQFINKPPQKGPSFHFNRFISKIEISPPQFRDRIRFSERIHWNDSTDAVAPRSLQITCESSSSSIYPDMAVCVLLHNRNMYNQRIHSQKPFVLSHINAHTALEWILTTAQTMNNVGRASMHFKLGKSGNSQNSNDDKDNVGSYIPKQNRPEFHIHRPVFSQQFRHKGLIVLAANGRNFRLARANDEWPQNILIIKCTRDKQQIDWHGKRVYAKLNFAFEWRARFLSARKPV